MRSPIPLFAVAAVGLSAWAASCQRADSIVLVEVAGDVKLMPAAFVVTVTPRQVAARTLRVAPHTGGAISLPASFTIQLPGTATGPITIGVQGLDTNDTLIAQGTATQQNLNVGGQTILPIALVAAGSIAVTTPDAGAGGVDAHVATDAQSAPDAQPGIDAAPPVDAPAGTDARAAADGAAGAGGQS